MKEEEEEEEGTGEKEKEEKDGAEILSEVGGPVTNNRKKGGGMTSEKGRQTETLINLAKHQTAASISQVMEVEYQPTPTPTPAPPASQPI